MPIKMNRDKPKGKQQARFGGMKQDRHGEWWVLVLVDSKWYRAKEMGVETPSFR